MKLAIMQPYLFPYIGYWQLLQAVDKFILFDDVNFIKKGYINRNSILIDGREHKFSLELRKQSQNKLINEIEVGDNKEKLLKTRHMAYRKAPRYDEVYPVLEKVIRYDEANLARYVGVSLYELSDFLGIDVEIVYSSDIAKDEALKGKDKIIDICRALGASEYINAAGGRSLYDRADFDKMGISLKFIEMGGIHYRQFENDFVPNLSIIDVMMFNDLHEIGSMFENYKLV